MAIELYEWNIDLASALFHRHLGTLEVLIRNALHREMAANYNRHDWWNSSDAWRNELDDYGRKRVRKALDGARCPGDVVAALSFGFWCALLDRNHERLWRAALHRAFPEYRGTRKRLHKDLYHLVRLRNRLAHHEPIHARQGIALDHEKIIRISGLISMEMAQWMRERDPVPEVLARRPKTDSAS